MKTCSLILIVMLLVAGCAHLSGPERAVQVTHSYEAPESEGTLVNVVDILIEPVTAFIELTTTAVSPIASGVGSALNALGVGLGSALMIGPQGDHALTHNTVTGYGEVVVSQSESVVGTTTSQAGRIEGSSQINPQQGE